MTKIDLHDLTVAGAIEEFVRAYNRLFESGRRGRIEVVHGYGSSGVGGAIRQKLRAFLNANADRFDGITPGESLGNPGMTVVYPKGRLPLPHGGASDVEGAVLEFCGEAKSEKKILAKLAGRYGDPAIRAAIRALVKRGALEDVRTARETRYRSM